MSKITIIGSGFVGSTTTYALMLHQIVDEIALIDINEKSVEAEVADIKHGFSNLSKTIIKKGTYQDCIDSQIIVVTAGVNRKPGETRLDLLAKNEKIIENIAICINAVGTNAIVIIVSNPVDILTYKMDKLLGFEKGQVFGTGCMLDSSRLICILAERFNVSVENVSGQVIGEHGDAQFILWDSVKINNEKVNLTDEEKAEIAQQVKQAGMKIILGKGRTHFGIASCVATLSKAIINDEDLETCVSLPLEKEETALSFPCRIGKNGAIVVGENF